MKDTKTYHGDTVACRCVRCQQPYSLTVGYRVTHICRQCRNGLIAVWAQVATTQERFGVIPSKIFRAA